MARSESWQFSDNPVWETRSPYLVKTVLAQKKELETQTVHDKARLRVEAEKHRKRAQQLELQYKQLQVLPHSQIFWPVKSVNLKTSTYTALALQTAASINYWSRNARRQKRFPSVPMHMTVKSIDG